jgi:osmotically-inducible protein OsmY
MWARNISWVHGVKAVDNSGLEVNVWAKDDMKREKRYTQKPDDRIREVIKRAFLHDPRVNSFNPEVEVKNGVVILTGKVDNLAARQAAEDDAWNTVGVWHVINNLKVRPVILLSNRRVRDDILAALARDPFVERHEVTVSVLNGKAYLYGTVDSYFEKHRCADVASRVNGVVEVENSLVVDYYWTWKSDREIKEDVESELWWSPFVGSAGIDVTVNDGVAVLTGEVDSWTEHGAATENAFEGGAKAVRNKLTVAGATVEADGDWYYPSYEQYHSYWLMY